MAGRRGSQEGMQTRGLTAKKQKVGDSLQDIASDVSPPEVLQEMEGEGSREINADANRLCEEFAEAEEMPELEREIPDQTPIPSLERRSINLEKNVGALMEMMQGMMADFKQERQENLRRETRRMEKETELERRQSRLEERMDGLMREQQTSTPERERAERPQPSFSSIDRPPSTVPTPVALNIHTKDAPSYKATATCMDPVARNQELEDWLLEMEIRFDHLPDPKRVEIARAHCRGDAGVMMQDEAFATMRSWATYKEEMRQHFKVRTSVGAIVHQLTTMSLRPDQSPADLFQKIRSICLAGSQEHPKSFGDPHQVARYHFLQALPNWLREVIHCSADGPIKVLVERAQENWSGRKLTRSTGQGNTERRWERHVMATDVEEDEAECYELAYQGGSGPRAPRRWVNRDGYDQQPGRGGRRGQVVCFGCNRSGHFVRQCPFLVLRGENAPLTTERPTQGPATAHSAGARSSSQQQGVRFNEEN